MWHFILKCSKLHIYFITLCSKVLKFFSTFASAKFEPMILRLRPVLTILLLLLFSLENVTYASMDAGREKYSDNHHFSTHKETPVQLSFIIEESENEERNDDKVPNHHAPTVHPLLVCHPVSKTGHKQPGYSLLTDNQHILKLICRLSIWEPSPLPHLTFKFFAC